MAWILVIVAGLFEIVWAVSLKLSVGFTKPLPIIVLLLAMGCSGFLLWLSLRWVPLSTAYAVWTGIGAAGTAAVGMIWFHEPSDWPRILCLALIVIGIIGLKLVSI